MSNPARARLAAAHCIARNGPGQQLPAGQVAALVEALADWALSPDGQALQRSFHFADYHQTMAFVNALAFIAQRENHHPDLGVHYNRVDVRLTTHDAGGLTENDFICAARFDQLLA